MRQLLSVNRAPRPRVGSLALVLLAGLAASALLAGCGGIGGDPLNAASVDGHAISLAAYQRIVSVYEISAAQQGQLVSWQTPVDRTALSRVQQAAMDFLVTAQLIHEQMLSQHVTVSPKDIQTIAKQLATQVQSGETPSPSATEYHTLTVAAQQAARQNPAQVDLPGLIAGRPSVADAFMIFSYDEAEQSALITQLKVPQAHLRIIEVATQQTAAQLRDQVVKQHADFGELAKQNSLDKQTASSGGEIGIARVGQLGQIDPSFDTAIFGPTADYHTKTSYAIMPYQGKYLLIEISQRSTVALSSITDQQTQQATYNAWLGVVVRPAASIHQFVAVDATPTPAPALGG